jgi:miniconductance mechanosensitive channel
MGAFANGWLSLIGILAVLALVAFSGKWLTTWVFRGLIRRIAARTKSTWDDYMIERNVLVRVSYIVPAVITYYGIGPALGVTPADITAAVDPTALILTTLLVERVSLAFIVLAAVMALTAALDAVNDIYNESYSEAKTRPIKGYLQVIGLVAYIAAGVVIVSILADRSPIFFLSGLGALTAVLLLVFRDTILSLVASVQIMSNDMIRIGDWVEMPQANADGDVIDIALHTVKIQNWDMTISAVPTHKFIGESFKNWRGMSESGGRRIKRALHLDMNSVGFLSDDEIARLSRYEMLRDYMAGKQGEIAGQGPSEKSEDSDVIPEKRRLSNVGTFRAYVLNYLKAHPMIHNDMTLIVRQLAPGPQGLPLELYCFSNDTNWSTYEGLQSDIFDHMISILPEFGLRAFQEPAGTDFASLGTDRGD